MPLVDSMLPMQHYSFHQQRPSLCIHTKLNDADKREEEDGEKQENNKIPKIIRKTVTQKQQQAPAVRQSASPSTKITTSTTALNPKHDIAKIFFF